ncbi:hypothetical protein SCP_0705900 [Sparassis crispa]|uniref:Reverse transcriptase/retrotransposon-derived protein RNase H-like domain-containing protein n=1 Tax=Sparassis crispa TaxID=139825 RepID=A0A401GTA1_9APHY|nr:hypothetical protein SCP_0705900 [Sparassis crispa]GBE85403.1 hypothetical protein SCP_0705900 [Sparassis crispa]
MADATLSGKKCNICRPELEYLGGLYNYEGRWPLPSHIQKIVDWPACTTVTEVRGFLGTCGLVRVFIKDYAKMVQPLTTLMHKETEFSWGNEEDVAMAQIKQAVQSCGALVPIDYASLRIVILAVDSSNIAVELYGLFRALRAVRIYIIGVANLVIEVDVKYIKGMLNNPNIQPNATINRWIAGILLFDFRLVHVPGSRHTGADSLSHHPRANEDPEEDDDFEQWLDEANAFTIDAANFRIMCEGWQHACAPGTVLTGLNARTPDVAVYTSAPEDVKIP